MNNVFVSFHPMAGQPSDCQPSCAGQPPNEFADTIVLPWNDPAALRTAFKANGDKIAAVITEPLLANSGCCEPREGYLEAIVELCRQNGAVSVFDEVITGFRLAAGGAREYYNVAPDLSIYGKALAGGFSLSAVAGRSQMFDVLCNGRTIHVGTYNGNPICLAAARATLEVLAEKETFRSMHTHGNALRETIERAANDAGVQLAICGAGTVFAVHLGVSGPPRDYRQTLRSDMAAYTRFRMAMLDAGVYLLPDGRWYVGAAHNAEALGFAQTAIERGFQSIRSNGNP
jgi:glutamate-1-semialdehyde 2,1-aminomutase